MSRYTALYDACVLYPAPLRDLLVQLALCDLFRARWTEQIHEEWINAILRERNDLQRKDLLRTKELMDLNVRDCLVTGYEPLIDTLDLPDKDDRHVLAAAISGRADVIVTFNLKDFPNDKLVKHNIEAQHPDEFIAHLIDLEPTVVLGAAKTIRARLKAPEKSAEEYLEALARQGLPITVAFLTENIALI